MTAKKFHPIMAAWTKGQICAELNELFELKPKLRIKDVSDARAQAYVDGYYLMRNETYGMHEDDALEAEEAYQREWVESVMEVRFG